MIARRLPAPAGAPPLLGHLVASRPDRDAGAGAASTAASVLLHAALLTALVWATLSIGHAAPPQPTETVRPVYLPTAPVAPRSAQAAPRPTLPSAASRIALPTAPIVTPATIPIPVPGATLEPARYDMPDGGAAGATAAAGAAGRTGDAVDPFIVRTAEPRLKDPARAAALFRRAYPAILRDAGIGGAVLVWIEVDTAGRVLQTRLRRSSGNGALDRAALEAAHGLLFSPAMNRDTPVRVWIALPVEFEAR